jgi:asparagine synthase (glutamine-hydrolysing)
VDRQTVADVPLCSLLSGGLDSSVVSALAAGSLRRQDHAKLATFSVDFTGSADAFTLDQLRPSHDEPFARAAAGHIGSRHGTITLEAEDLVTAQWAPLAAHDLPTFGDMYVSFVLLCREISKQSTVALSGEAADEVFGGYPWYHVPALLAAPTFPWAARGSWEPLLQPDVRARVRLGEYAADRYAQALAEVPRLAGESQQDRRIREVLYLGLTRWLPFLLDRKDHREERLQIEGHRPQRVRPAPARHELQIPVHQPLAQAIPDLARPRHEPHKTREAAHISTIPVRDTRTQERHGSPVY